MLNGLYSFASARGKSGKLSILLFHKLPAKRDPLLPTELCLDEFERVLAWLTRYFSVLPLRHASQLMVQGKLPRRAVAITFDDGYKDWTTGVTALLKRYRAPATFFITTEQLAGRPIWNERALAAVRALPDRGARLPTALASLSDLTDITKRRRLVAALDDQLKYFDLASRDAAIEALEAQAIAPLNVAAPFTCDDVRALRNDGFDIGAHTVRHPILQKCSDEQARDELVRSKAQLESVIGEPVTMFAYPNGKPNVDYAARHVEMVREAGYEIALSTARGAASASRDLLELPRFSPWGRSRFRMALQVAQNIAEPPVTAERGRKRVLMVAFHFPPQAGSSGVLRTLNFVKHLPRHGWDATVLTARPSAYDECRDDLLPSIPPGTSVVRAFALNAARHLGLFGKYPRIFSLPDRWSSWWAGGVIAGLGAITRERPTLIWSTYPIASAHLIGGTLARLTGTPWIADFRDPMLSRNYPADALVRTTWQWIEAYVLRCADRCIFTTERAAAVYRERYPAAAAKIAVIENGYDEDAFAGVMPRRLGADKEKLLLLHSGIIYPQERDPGAFFKAVKQLIADARIDPARLCIRFRAPHHSDHLLVLARQHGVHGIVEIAPPVAYREALAEMLAADLLVVLQGTSFNSQIPAKIYEYLRAQRPILALVDRAGDTAHFLSRFNGVAAADIADVDEIAAALEICFRMHADAALPSLLQANQQQVVMYSRAAQAERLAQLLGSIATTSEPRAEAPQTVRS